MPAKFTCRSCLKYVVIDDQQSRDATTVECSYCGARLIVPVKREVASRAELNDYRATAGKASSPVAGVRSPAVPPTGETGEGSIDALGMFAWLILIAHALFALLLLLGVARVDTRYGVEWNAVIVWVAIGVLAEGVFLCVLFRALHWTGKNVIRVVRDIAGRTG